MRIRWFDAARADLVEIRRFIADQDHPAAAESAAQSILGTVIYLRDHPAIGRPGRVTGTREVIIAGLPYIVPYRIRDGVLEILRVLHMSRQWPKDL